MISHLTVLKSRRRTRMSLNKLQQRLLKLGLPPNFIKQTCLPDGATVEFELNRNSIRVKRSQLVIRGHKLKPNIGGPRPTDCIIGYVCVECGWTSSVRDLEDKFRLEHGSCNMTYTYCNRCKKKNTAVSICMSDVTSISIPTVS